MDKPCRYVVVKLNDGIHAEGVAKMLRDDDPENVEDAWPAFDDGFGHFVRPYSRHPHD
jgi:hypothetical protein